MSCVHKATEQSVHLTCGILRDFRAFALLRVFPAPDPLLPRPQAGNAIPWVACVKLKNIDMLRGLRVSQLFARFAI